MNRVIRNKGKIGDTGTENKYKCAEEENDSLHQMLPSNQVK